MKPELDLKKLRKFAEMDADKHGRIGKIQGSLIISLIDRIEELEAQIRLDKVTECRHNSGPYKEPRP